jgi:hypothetical protein
MMKSYFQPKYTTVKQLIIVVTGFAFLVSCNSGKQQTNLTFNKEIAPLVHKHCTPCHRPGEAGPFHLISYKDVRKKAKTIARVVETGVMPPWPADPEYTHFVGEKILTDAEKEMIVSWVNCRLSRRKCPQT